MHVHILYDVFVHDHVCIVTILHVDQFHTDIFMSVSMEVPEPEDPPRGELGQQPKIAKKLMPTSAVKVQSLLHW